MNPSSADFELHPRLAADCLFVGDLPLCRLLLMNDAQYPWCILVPRRAGILETHELEARDREQLLEESCALAQAMGELFAAEKMNLGAIGNLVPQLHWHHVARYRSDPAWPAPVWGKLPPVPYVREEGEKRAAALRAALGMATG